LHFAGDGSVPNFQSLQQWSVDIPSDKFVIHYIVYKDDYINNMSRLSRAMVRRDKALTLCEMVSLADCDRQPLSVSEDLTKILRDIPVEKIGALPNSASEKPSFEWETIGVVAKIASITSLWETPIGSIHSYFPHNSKEWLQTFRTRWQLVKDTPSNTVTDFLKLMVQKPLEFTV
jgi:hypothetical protein